MRWLSLPCHARSSRTIRSAPARSWRAEDDQQHRGSARAHEHQESRCCARRRRPPSADRRHGTRVSTRPLAAERDRGACRQPNAVRGFIDSARPQPPGRGSCPGVLAGSADCRSAAAEQQDPGRQENAASDRAGAGLEVWSNVAWAEPLTSARHRPPGPAGASIIPATEDAWPPSAAEPEQRRSTMVHADRHPAGSRGDGQRDQVRRTCRSALLVRRPSPMRSG